MSGPRTSDPRGPEGHVEELQERQVNHFELGAEAGQIMHTVRVIASLVEADVPLGNEFLIGATFPSRPVDELKSIFERFLLMEKQESVIFLKHLGPITNRGFAYACETIYRATGIDLETTLTETARRLDAL